MRRSNPAVFSYFKGEIATPPIYYKYCRRLAMTVEKKCAIARYLGRMPTPYEKFDGKINQ
jgi:hypothetical protein